ncbi:hypothetical protein ILFOPFJJ_05730 [Ensifer psoraleae]|nr:hypothetical protein [Sinorhizobium psoraleae]
MAADLLLRSEAQKRHPGNRSDKVIGAEHKRFTAPDAVYCEIHRVTISPRCNFAAGAEHGSSQVYG